MREHVIVGVVGAESVARAPVLAAIEAAGATPELWAEATAITKAVAVDAIVFDVGSAPERFVPIAAVLGTDPRTRWVPRVLIVAADTPVHRIAAFGAAAVVPSTSDAALVAAAVAGAVEQVRARNELERREQKGRDAVRAVDAHLVTLREEANTLSHDARVLFGVILGFASNLRDGISGPISETQRVQLGNIMEASTDAAALLERHVVAWRRGMSRDDSSDESAALARRLPPRRRQNDLGDLVRGTVVLFGGVAAAKQIRLTAAVARGVPSSWCDAMQIKQALVNLIANALKFTPAGGAVEVAVRCGPPASVRGGATARRDVEIAVSDTGPGIPVEERENVFERGARLARDGASPGSGIGLAVVRDDVEQHGGVVHIEDAPGGGACFVLTIPSDLRARAADQRGQATREGSG
jgi:signal transduction histidine kinase